MPWIDYDHDEPEEHYVGAVAAYVAIGAIVVLSVAFFVILWWKVQP